MLPTSGRVGEEAMEDLMVEFLVKYWDRLLTGGVAAMTPIIIGLIGYYKLKRHGVNESNLLILLDNQKFRKELLEENAALREEMREQKEHFDSEIAASRSREYQLTRQNSEQQGTIDTLRADMRELKQNRQANRDRIRTLENQVKTLTQERDQFKARLT